MIRGNMMTAYSVLFSGGEQRCFMARDEEQAFALACYYFPDLSVVSLEEIDNDQSVAS